MGEQLHTKLKRCPAVFFPADAAPQGAGKDPGEVPWGAGGWRLLGRSATDPSCPSLSCPCRGLAVNPSPFSHHKGKKITLQGCRGMELAGRVGRRGLLPGSLFATQIQASSHQLGFVLPPNSQ